ncbi:unnamed protein product (macronuclear) [Paramecium tetraurelia]|uniref:Uncharacterized protein n=1 Tax=Paramecium tetraurelia TaxID=5888 RepID=A0C0W5_PARTE|nr:uncharacterized protein GSPATT00033908001 [Paramecium tetraurelia]CAK64432.1 unnamed protein product [Paramecium tetraurelia]|eukprot:XP_001431830.1 hypothetical protein (macronuclear) [Paramecium tetraurelia strain d4-2]
MESQDRTSQKSSTAEIQEVFQSFLQKPLSIDSSDDCIELKPQEYKVSILKQKLKNKQQTYSLTKILFGFRFDYQKAACLICKKEGHVNCCQINFQIDNIYKK